MRGSPSAGKTHQGQTPEWRHGLQLDGCHGDPHVSLSWLAAIQGLRLGGVTTARNTGLSACSATNWVKDVPGCENVKYLILRKLLGSLWNNKQEPRDDCLWKLWKLFLWQRGETCLNKERCSTVLRYNEEWNANSTICQRICQHLKWVAVVSVAHKPPSCLHMLHLVSTATCYPWLWVAPAYSLHWHTPLAVQWGTSTVSNPWHFPLFIQNKIVFEELPICESEKKCIMMHSCSAVTTQWKVCSWWITCRCTCYQFKLVYAYSMPR